MRVFKTSKRNKYILILFLLSVIAFTFYLSVMINKGYSTYANSEVFVSANKVSVYKNQTLPGDDENRTGMLLSATDSGASIQINESLSGDFSAEFLPYSSETGNPEFSSLIFTFQSEETRTGFYVKFVPNSNGALMIFGLSSTDRATKTSVSDCSFCNLNKKSFSFSFKSDSMRVMDGKNATLADMKDESFMREFLTVSTLSSWEKYSVSVSFGGIEAGKTAKVLFYTINGQELGGNELKNTAGPVIVKQLSVKNGVVNKPYAIDTSDILTYDLLDGYKTEFTGKIEVFDSENKGIVVNNNGFIPNKSGNYTLTYIPKDSGGVYGKKYVANFCVFPYVPKMLFSYETNVEENEIGVGSSVYLPKAMAKSDLSHDSIPAYVKVLKGDTEQKPNCISTGEFYKFTETGDYCVVYNCQDSTGTYFEEKFNIVVSDIPFVNSININSTYAVGSKFNVPMVEFEYGNSKISAQSTLIFPNGNRSQSNSVNISQEGLYTLLYEFQYNGQSYKREIYFNAVKYADLLFTTTDGLTVSADYNAPDYVDYAYNGIILTARQPITTEFVNVIDLSDNTENDVLVEFFVSPKEASNMEFDKLDIYFYDIYDENNFIHIRFEDDPWRYYFYAMSVIGMTVDEVDTTSDANIRKYFYNNFVYSSFYGKDSSKGIYPSQSVKLYFDYESGKLYANLAAKNADLSVSKLGVSRLIADLKDESWVGKGNAYKGFTTGAAKMVVKMSGLKSEANMMILNVDGQNLSGKQIADDVAPAIFIDYDGNDPSNLPLGILDKEYTVYKAYGWDVFEGYINDVKSEVYYISSNNSLEKVRVYNGKFLPVNKGNYQIIYSVSDRNGNESSKAIVITVVDETDIADINYTFSNKLVNSAVQGDTIRIYDGVAAGGTGALTVYSDVVFNDKIIELDENNSFRAIQYGTYTLRVRVKDYNGISEPFEFNIEVVPLQEAFIYETTINGVVRAGEEVVFPKFRAVKFVEGIEEEIDVKYFIDGAELGSDRAWTPLSDTDYTFTVKAENTEKNYIIHSIKQNSGEFSSSYFYAESSEMQINKTGISFCVLPADTDNFKVSMVRAVNQNFLSYSIKAESENFSLIKAILTDSLNPDEKVETFIRKGVGVDGTENCAFFVVNGKETQMRNNFIGTNVPLTIQYVPDKFMIVDDLNNVLGTITHTANGNVFHGFSSGSVYLTFYVGDADAMSEETVNLCISSIGGQSFNSNIKSDRTGPLIKVLGENGEVRIGGELPVYSAISYDLLSGLKSLTVTVAFNGQILYKDVSCDKAFGFTVDKYGTYSIQYSATDMLGNTRKANRVVSVVDRIPPQIEILGTVVSVAKVNTEYGLPNYNVSDDYSEAENIKAYIYYIAPNGKMARINDYVFKPDQTGIFKIIYMAKDESGNTAIRTLSVNVIG